jgi:hypothetical protein
MTSATDGTFSSARKPFILVAEADVNTSVPRAC